MTSSESVFFHVAAGLYGPNDQILPGNWGRIVEGIGPKGASYYREFAFEQVRQAEFPNRVSRMRAAFAFQSRDAATTHRETTQAGIDLYVYAVKVQPGARMDMLDMGWIDVLPEFRSHAGVREAIRAYWRGAPRDPSVIELLTDSPLAVIERLTPIMEDGRS